MKEIKHLVLDEKQKLHINKCFNEKGRMTMERAEVAAKIREMLIENLRIPAEILEDDSELFGGDIGLDSVDSLEIIAGIDDLYGVNMTGVDKTNFRDINALTNYVVEHAEA